MNRMTCCDLPHISVSCLVVPLFLKARLIYTGNQFLQRDALLSAVIRYFILCFIALAIMILP